MRRPFGDLLAIGVGLVLIRVLTATAAATTAATSAATTATATAAFLLLVAGLGLLLLKRLLWPWRLMLRLPRRRLLGLRWARFTFDDLVAKLLGQGRLALNLARIGNVAVGLAVILLALVVTMTSATTTAPANAAIATATATTVAATPAAAVLGLKLGRFVRDVGRLKLDGFLFLLGFLLDVGLRRGGFDGIGFGDIGAVAGGFGSFGTFGGRLGFFL